MVHRKNRPLTCGNPQTGAFSVSGRASHLPEGERAAGVSSDEITTPDGAVLRFTEPALGIWGYQEGDHVTGPEARKLAAALILAADA